MRKPPSQVENTQTSAQDLTVANEQLLTIEAALERIVGRVPNLPQDALQRAARVVARLPVPLRTLALSILVGKMSHDFALRCLLLLGDALTGKEDTDFEFVLDTLDPRDQQVLRQLLASWLAVAETPKIQSIEDFGRFANVSAGLLRLIDASSPEGRRSWLFDAAPQYQSRLAHTSLFVQQVEGADHEHIIVDAELPTQHKSEWDDVEIKPLVMSIQGRSLLYPGKDESPQIVIG